MVRANTLRNTEKRTLRRHKESPIDVEKTKEYTECIVKKKSLENKREQVERKMEELLEPIKVSRAYQSLEKQLFKIDDQLGDLSVKMNRIEALVLQALSIGQKVKDFAHRIISKRFTPKYKAICEEIFAGRPKEFEEAKERHGSRKEQFILLYRGEEVGCELVEHLVPKTPQETV